MVIVGIDSGKTGGIVAINSETKRGHYCKLKYDKAKMLDCTYISTLLSHYKPTRIILEKVHAGGGGTSGATTAFAMGFYYGQILTIVKQSYFPYLLTTPQTWQKVAHEGTDHKLDAKQKSLVAYGSFFPHRPIILGPRAKAPHDGVVDALLICVYGFQKYGIAPNGWALAEWDGV